MKTPTLEDILKIASFKFKKDGELILTSLDADFIGEHHGNHIGDHVGDRIGLHDGNHFGYHHGNHHGKHEGDHFGDHQPTTFTQNN